MNYRYPTTEAETYNVKYLISILQLKVKSLNF
jgi:hypothetical protein